MTPALRLSTLSGANLRMLVGPGLIVLILAMMVLPLPPFVLDVLFTFNIALAVMVLLVGLYAMKPLDFAAFPTVLLITTLMRLSLNVASTRIVLLEGHTGADAAGKVIEAFGHFVVGGNYAVGIVVFVILVVINFVVVTKGAGRIAEVSARFTLDAMPGKQMAIDADLNAGLIGEEEARKRRAAIAQEADFFGAMDGASKFVRGDAIAGIVILLIGIVGGFAVGVLQHDLDVGAAARNYTLLTIGDGLVAQIPALVISTAAGIVVSRVATDEDVGQQLIGQLFNKPRALALTAGILALMGSVPGMPHVAFMLLALVLGAAAYVARARAVQREIAPPPAPPAAPDTQDASWDDVAAVDTLGLEVGYRLITLVDRNQDGELLRRIRGIRRKFAQEVGFLVPAVHIRDNLALRPNGYRITVKGVEVGAGESFLGMHLAINPGRVSGTLPGTPTRDPAFGLPAVWIEAAVKERAQSLGYTVVDAGVVVATHIDYVIRSNAADLMGRFELQQLIDRLNRTAPKLVEEVVPKLLPVATVQKVVQNLLAEGVHVRDFNTIMEALAEHAPRTQAADELTAAVRVALGRSIVQQIFTGGGELQVFALEPQLERILMQALQSGGAEAGMEPGIADTLLAEASACAERQEQLGLPPVLLVPAPLRLALSRFLRRSLPQLRVLSHAEITHAATIKVTSLLGGKP
jgi:flagellar biosynthesis protein FlhA